MKLMHHYVFKDDMRNSEENLKLLPIHQYVDHPQKIKQTHCLHSLTRRAAVEHIPPPHNAWSTRIYRAQYIFEISYYISLLALSLMMVKNHFIELNNSRIQIQIQIFTKVQSICHGHKPNLSTKFHPNPSTTFWDIVLYIGLAEILPPLNGEESL